MDLSAAQLDTARRCQQRHNLFFPLVEADAGQVPLRSGMFDLVVSEYGAAPWREPAVWLPEAARLLRPMGRLVFLTHSVTIALCVPEEGGVAGDRLLRAQRDVARIEWPGGGIEHHPSHSDWIHLLRANSFEIDALHELFPPPDTNTPDFYDIVTADWATRWPAEDAWIGSPTRHPPRRRVASESRSVEDETAGVRGSVRTTRHRRTHGTDSDGSRRDCSRATRR